MQQAQFFPFGESEVPQSKLARPAEMGTTLSQGMPRFTGNPVCTAACEAAGSHVVRDVSFAQALLSQAL